jgi:tetraacyldisaccharide-1-P 4'-kinase
MTVATTVAQWLETGRFSGPAARAVANAHAVLARRAVARPLRVPVRGAHEPALVTITVGGATLGGSGRTRVALACVHELAGRGAQVALVGHAYGAAPGLARVVSAADALGDVGDEALACARALAKIPNARVVVGPTRQAAVDHAATLEPRVRAIVLDGPLQLAPSRASLSVLALDADAPWGAGAVPPAGDLRAPRDALLAHADHVVSIDAMPCGAMLDGGVVDLASLRSSLPMHARIGLFTALARPERLARGLARAGLVACTTVRIADHGPVTPAARRRLVDSPVDLWLATSKCATHLEGLALGAPLAILDGSLVLPAVLSLALEELLRGSDAISHPSMGRPRARGCDMRTHGWLDPSIRKALVFSNTGILRETRTYLRAAARDAVREAGFGTST